jgi:hypothetical protein
VPSARPSNRSRASSNGLSHEMRGFAAEIQKIGCQRLRDASLILGDVACISASSEYPTETGLPGWACRIRTGESVRELSDWNSVTTSPGVGASPRRRPFAGELHDTGLQLQPRFHQANLARKSGQHHEDRVASGLIVGLEILR